MSRMTDLDAIAWCLHEACERDLPAVHFPPREAPSGRVYGPHVRRPHEVDHAIEVYSWMQTWSSTALGMGVGGQAMTSARTTVVVDYDARVACVYVSRHLRGRIVWDDEARQRVAAHDIISRQVPHGTPIPPDPETDQ